MEFVGKGRGASGWPRRRPIWLSLYVPTPWLDGGVRQGVRSWIARQRLNAAIGLEYAKYRRRLRGRDLGRFHVPGELRNDHIPRVVARPPDRPLRIFAFWRDASWESHSLLPALRAFGEVTHYDPYPDFEVAYGGRETDWGARARMQDEVWRLIRDGMPWDLLFFYTSGAYFDPALCERIRGLGVPTVNFGLDDITFFEDRVERGVHRGCVDIARYFTVYGVSSVIGLHKALAVGATPYYPFIGADESAFFRMPGVERDLDVVLVGARFYDRGETVQYLDRYGVRVHAYGAGWKAGRVSNEEKLLLYNRARIVLGFNRANGSDWMSVKGRDHEVTLTGAFYLTNYFPELVYNFVPGVEVGVYQNRSDLRRKIAYYLDHPEQRERVAQAGWRRARREHTWRARLGDVLWRLGLLRDPPALPALEERGGAGRIAADVSGGPRRLP